MPMAAKGWTGSDDMSNSRMSSSVTASGASERARKKRSGLSGAAG
jgi:hypothetical protein